MKPAIASLFALGTTFCLMGTKTRHEVPTFGTSRRLMVYLYVRLSRERGGQRDSGKGQGSCRLKRHTT